MDEKCFATHKNTIQKLRVKQYNNNEAKSRYFLFKKKRVDIYTFDDVWVFTAISIHG